MDRWEDICEAIASMAEQTLPTHEIILVVDYNELLLARAKDALSNAAQVIPNKMSRGLSGARNTGIAAATGDLLAFLDDDAVADADWLEALAAECEASNVLGVTSSSAPVWRGAKPGWFPEEFLWTVGCSYRGQPERIAEVRNVLGGASLIKRSIFSAAGGFSSELGHFGGNLASCEDTEFCLRAKAANPSGRFVLVPHTKIQHKVPAGRLTLRYFLRRCYAEGHSKALLQFLAPQRGALETERDYVRRVLVSGIANEMRDAAAHFDASALGRAASIVLGLATTAFGYATGQLAQRRRPRRLSRRPDFSGSTTLV